LLISTPSGIDIPLSSVANVELKESINQIQRENAQEELL
jgi:cobalt-zinc-cadmium resistance protein CzcA